MPTDWATFLSGAAGAFGAAWLGAYAGFRRSRMERALDRRIAWHESTIQVLAQYEEALERLRSHSLNVLIVQRTAPATQSSGESAADLPERVKVPAALWNELRQVEVRARAALRLGDLYTEGRTQVDCSVALTRSVNIVSSHWLDLSDEPEIPWVHLAAGYSVAEVRNSLQESMRVVLELDGFVASLLGKRYRRWRRLRVVRELQADHDRLQQLIAESQGA